MENARLEHEELQELITISKNRQNLVETLQANDSDEGLKSLLSGMYASHGHFIYELLQNAEDAKAKNVIFNLQEDTLIFSHDGTKLFTINDIASITNIGNSTKKIDGNSIGKFGVGFKSVYDYCEVPDIKSGKFHFSIENMLYPNVDFNNTKFYTDTIISLPLGTQTKTAKDCKSEIDEALRKLPYDTLLFLKNIESIHCKIGNYTLDIKKAEDVFNENCSLCNLIYRDGDKPKKCRRFLRFSKNVSVLDNTKNEEVSINISIAYKVLYDKKKMYKLLPILDENEQPAGKVYTFFECKNEISNLCFHIHAPFELPPTREALKDSKTNKIVINHLVNLVKESINFFKFRREINQDLFSVLPLPSDKLPSKYSSFSTSIIDLFNNKPYLPMADGKFENAKGKIYNTEKDIYIYNNDFLNFLERTNNINYKIAHFGFLQGRAMDFLSYLEITKFTVDYVFVAISTMDDEDIEKYFATKSPKWMYYFYTFPLKYMELGTYTYYYSDYFNDFPLCRCENDIMELAPNCFFKRDDIDPISSDVLFIDPKIYTFDGKIDNDQKEKIQKILQVPDYDLGNVIYDTIRNYNENDNRTTDSLMAIFDMYHKNPAIFSNLSIYGIQLLDRDGNYRSSSELYLGNKYGIPVKNLPLYYDILNNQIATHENIYPWRKLKITYELSLEYLNKLSSKDTPKFVSFLKLFGIIDTIPISETSCSGNDNYEKIFEEAEWTEGRNSQQTNIDYDIYCLKDLLRCNNEEVFELIWTLLDNTPINTSSYLNNFSYTQCRFRYAKKFKEINYPSQLLNNLMNYKWILQIKNGIQTFCKPENAKKEFLPPSVLSKLDHSNNITKWLEVIEFGSSKSKLEAKIKEENDYFKKAGLDPNVAQSIIKASKKLPKDTVEKLFSQFIERLDSEMQSIDEEKVKKEFYIERIKEKSSELFSNATDITYSTTTRSVRDNISNNSQSAKNYLNTKYNDGEIFKCQLCHQQMPFKKPDGSFYFEGIQLFNSYLVTKELDYNRIALCPTCAAKMKVYYNKDFELQQELFNTILNSDEETNEFSLSLDKDYMLYFKPEHIAMLKEILKHQEEEE